MSATERPKDIAIVGAGLIGSELARDLALDGHRITLLDVQPEPSHAGAPKAQAANCSSAAAACVDADHLRLE